MQQKGVFTAPRPKGFSDLGRAAWLRGGVRHQPGAFRRVLRPNSASLRESGRLL